MSDPTPVTTALVRATERYSALARVWHDSRPTHTLPFERCVWSECQIERHDALIAALAAAEAPGRVAAGEAREALARALLAATGVPWDRTEVSVRDAYLDEADAILAALPDGWTLAAPAPTPSERVQRIRDEQASGGGPVTAVMVSRGDEAPAPTPSEPVARCGFTYPSGLVCDHERVSHVHDKVWAFQHPFTPGARDE